MTGEADYLVRIVVKDVRASELFIVDELSKIQGVARIRASFALKQVKYKTALPLSL
jgi:Lrp/AsnC family leucine-responsive transcriptional regulator